MSALTVYRLADWVCEAMGTTHDVYLVDGRTPNRDGMVARRALAFLARRHFGFDVAWSDIMLAATGTSERTHSTWSVSLDHAREGMVKQCPSVLDMALRYVVGEVDKRVFEYRRANYRRAVEVVG